jgi:hypothetical protein
MSEAVNGSRHPSVTVFLPCRDPIFSKSGETAMKRARSSMVRYGIGLRNRFRLLALLMVTPCIAAAGPSPTWIKQLGGSSYDRFNAVATDAQGNSVVTGHFGQTYGWFARFDAAGRLLWQTRLNRERPEAWGVAIDTSGNIIVVGETDYPEDAWIEKYTASGSRLWGRRFNSGRGDNAFRVAVDAANNIYIAGTSGQPTTSNTDALLVKFSPAGTLQWQKRIGTIDQDTSCNSITVDRSNNILLVGTAFGPLFGPDPQYNDRDAWVAKVDQNGRTLWGKQISENSSSMYGKAVTTDAQNNVLMFGQASGRRLPGSTQAGTLFILKFAPNGNRSWVRQFQYPGNSSFQEAIAIATDANSNVLVAGAIGRSVAGAAAYVRKYDSSGGLLWDSPLSSGEGETALGVATDSGGNVLVTGLTYGNLGATNQGLNDGFLAKFPPQ